MHIKIKNYIKETREKTMTKHRKMLFSTLFVASIAPILSIPALAASCVKDPQGEVQATQGYADQMSKLANKSITMAGAWADARTFAKEYAKDLIAVGSTDYISNDGVQARAGLKDGDIKAIQTLLKNVVKEAAKKQDKNLTYVDSKGKTQSIFKIYNHDDYSVVARDAKIRYNVDGATKNAYSETPQSGSDYFEMDAQGKVTVKAGSPKFKIRFIPSSDPTLVKDATQKLTAYFASIGITNLEITVASDYNQAAQQLDAKAQDLAFLPVNTWAEKSGKSNFILQAGRNVQIIDPYKSTTNPAEPQFNDEKTLINALNNYLEFNKGNQGKELYINKDKSKNPQAAAEGYTAEFKSHVDTLTQSGQDLPPVGFYRSYIYARRDSKIAKLILEAIEKQGSNWKLKWDDVKKYVVYGHTGKTSSASYVYPEKWFREHFEGFKSFDNIAK